MNSNTPQILSEPGKYLLFLTLYRFIPEDSFFKNEKFFDFESKSNDDYPITPKVQIPSSSIIPNGSTIIKPKISPPINVIHNFINRKRSLSYDKEKELKLLKNRLSARKCRQKKKIYIKQLEEQLKTYKDQIEYYKIEVNKNKSIENYISILEKNQKEIEQYSSTNKGEITKLEYKTTQKKILCILFIQQVKAMMPLDCKLFQNKFIKVDQFLEDDNIENIIGKVNNNIRMLNELYEFKKRNHTHQVNHKGKENIAYKLYLYYENMKKYSELFISHYSTI